MQCSGPLRRKALRRHNGINLFLARDKIAATACVTFNKSLIDNAIACLLASGAKTSRGNLDCLAIFLMEDDRHIVIRALDLCNGHHLSPSQWCPGVLVGLQGLSSKHGLHCILYTLPLRCPTLHTPAEVTVPSAALALYLVLVIVLLPTPVSNAR